MSTMKSPAARASLAALLTLTGIGSVPLAAQAAPAGGQQQVICDDIGLVRVERSAGSWRVLDQAPLSVAATGLACRAATTDAQGHLKVSGDPLLHVVADTEAVVAAADRAVAEKQAKGERGITAAAVADPAGYGPVVAFPFQSQLANYAASRSGSIGVAWRKAGSSTIHSYYKGSKSNVTASIVKVQIMATVMYQAQQKGRGLTSWEISQMIPMIKQSDNTAATNLYQHVGGRTAVQSVINRMGLRETTLGPGGYWGLTVTTAPDQVVLVDHFSRKNPVLNDSMRSYGLSLMRGASSWGVNQGPGTDIAVKNGWLPRTDGWHVNSVGYNHHAPAYTAAVLTHSASGSLETQKATIAGISQIIWKNRNASSTPTPTPVPLVRGDWTKDGRTDLLGIKNGVMYRFTAGSDRKLGAAVQIGQGWGKVNWIGSPGDVTGDRITDLLARDASGNLWLYVGNGKGSLSAGRQIGQGWGNMTALSAVGDFNANGTPDILARHRNGDLLRYSLPKTGAVAAGRVGTGWNKTVAILGVQGVNSDARADVLGMGSDGLMRAYTSTGTRLQGGAVVGQGWKPGMVASPGDLTGDGIDDIAYQSGTRLLTYPVKRGGSISAGLANGGTASGFQRIG
ncbi:MULTISPECIES: FG-GAP-like repeat-containing protein [unclassified Luteococcus]|uniref:FG-GAP-like repeat-containing protein n=1 Tax=unclassified Luteococcus TaxID=2639923 RepID=UPI00313C92AE